MELWGNPTFEGLMKKVHCDRLNNGPPKISMSQSLGPVNMLPHMAKGSLQM